ncbi:MAG: response regulator [Candidatus Zophobacter franzmannii]|nr:response regulator [Candidatus Zophobacter franzmannii]
MFIKDILIIDDSISFSESIKDLLEFEKPGWSIDKVHSGRDGIERLKKSEYKVILLDLKMPGMSGLEVLDKLATENLVKRNYIVILTGEITIENAVNTLKYGARDFIQKNTVVDDTDAFLLSISKGMEWQEERLQNEALLREKEQAIEESRLLVKSVGHDMSGSYYASLMLKLRMLKKRMNGISEIYNTQILPNVSEENLSSDVMGAIAQIDLTIKDSLERSDSIIKLLNFFKELGENLKELGDAIGIPQRPKKLICLSEIMHIALHTFSESRMTEKPDVKVMEDYGLDELKIMATEEDLFRVFMNLIENAYKAMGNEGILKLQTWSENGFAYAAVQDSGCGITKENLANIWRPDFTDWRNGQGTGLGLVICRKAVENSGGEISVSSEVDNGTRFILKFTLTD